MTWEFNGMKVGKVGAVCELCGKLFANSYMKQKHLEEHFYEGKKEGLIPHYVYDPSTGDSILKGMISKLDMED